MVYRKALKSDCLFISECLKDILSLHAKGRADIFKNCGGKYKIIDVAADFKGNAQTLTRIDEIDIHPNENGHKAIAEAVDEVLTAETYTYTTQVYGEPHLTLTAILLIAGGILAMLIIVVIIIPKLFKKYE